jgi:hypothetical protein
LEPVEPGSGDRLCPRGPETVGKNAQAAEEPLLLFVQQVMTPCHGRPQGSLAPRRVAPTARQHRQSAAESHDQLLGWKDRRPGGRQFDRQGKAVHAPADFDDGIPGLGHGGVGSKDLDGVVDRQGLDPVLAFSFNA